MIKYIALTTKEIGKRIRDFRTNRGLTQSDLGEMVAEDPTTISRIECGRKPIIPVDVLQRIAAALKVTLNDICYAERDSSSKAFETGKALPAGYEDGFVQYDPRPELKENSPVLERTKLNQSGILSVYHDSEIETIHMLERLTEPEKEIILRMIKALE